MGSPAGGESANSSPDSDPRCSVVKTSDVVLIVEDVIGGFPASS